MSRNPVPPGNSPLLFIILPGNYAWLTKSIIHTRLCSRESSARKWHYLKHPVSLTPTIFDLGRIERAIESVHKKLDDIYDLLLTLQGEEDDLG